MDHADQTMPVPRPLVLRLSYAVIALAIFLSVSTVHGMLVPDFDPWHQSISALALAPYRWIQILNFFVLGGSLLATVPTWRRVLRPGTGARSYPFFTMVLGISFLLAGCLPQDPAPGYDPEGLASAAPTLVGSLHLLVAGTAAASSVSLMFIVASRLSGDPHWPGWAMSTRVLALVMIACITVYGAWSTKPSGLAGTFERIAILIPAMWGGGFLRCLWAGRPFMQPLAQLAGEREQRAR